MRNEVLRLTKGKIDKKKSSIEICPKCNAELFLMLGYGFDFDMYICLKKECNYEKVLKASTYAGEEGV